MAFDPSNPNIGLFLRLEPTDPKYTKPITGKAFKGTALNGEYAVKRLTDAFGPVGVGWGYTGVFEDVHFPSGKSLNFCTLSFWYYPNGCMVDADGLLVTRGKRSETITQVGGTELGGSRKSGDSFADDEARKKSLTDALLKACSHVGIGADIHLGRYDDSKYVEERAQEEAKDTAAIARRLSDELAREGIAMAKELAAAPDTDTLMAVVDRARALHTRLREGLQTTAAIALSEAVQANMKRLGVAPTATTKTKAAAA
jgi:hypothetical protein